MSETRNFLMRRQAALEAEMHEAVARARAPYEAELKDIRMAISAMDRTGGGLVRPPAPDATEIPAKTAGVRGRRKRSLGEMVLMALRARTDGADTAGIQLAMERRWNCAIVESRLITELRQLQQLGLAVCEAGRWRAVEQGGLRVVAQSDESGWPGAGAPRELVLVS